jgi:phage baseplate assembly protein V
MKSYVRSLQAKLANLVVRGFVSLLSDATGVQVVQLQLRKDETASDVEHPQEFGFTSNCPDGSEALALFLMGDRDHGVSLIQFHRTKRKKDLAQGETAVYNDHGCSVHLKTGSTITITAATKLELISALMTITGNLTVVGDVSDSNPTTPTMAEMRAVYNSHKHGTSAVPTQQM